MLVYPAVSKRLYLRRLAPCSAKWRFPGAGMPRLHHLAFGFLHCLINLVEGFYGVEHLLHFRDLDFLIQDHIEMKVADFRSSLDDVRGFAMRRDQAAAVEFDPAILPDDSELHRKPEETAHALQLVLVVDEIKTYTAVVLEEIGKDGVRMHGNVSEDVVKDVRLWRVFHGLARADVGGCGELPRCKHLKKSVRREKAADGSGVPSGARPQPLVHGSEVWDGVLTQADLVEAVEVLRTGVLLKLRHAAAHQLRPDGVLLGCVGAPVLPDEIRSGNVQARCSRCHGELPPDPKLLRIAPRERSCQRGESAGRWPYQNGHPPALFILTPLTASSEGQRKRLAYSIRAGPDRCRCRCKSQRLHC